MRGGRPRSGETAKPSGLAVRCTTNNNVAHFNLAAELMKQQRYSDAIEHYLETVRIRPAYPHAQCNLAFALNRQGQTQEAIAHYYQAIKYDPGDRSHSAIWPHCERPRRKPRFATASKRWNSPSEPFACPTAANRASPPRLPRPTRKPAVSRRHPAARQAIAQAKQQNNRGL